MSAAMKDRWPSLFEERAEYINSIRHVAVATEIQVVVRGLDELAGLYGNAAKSPREREPAQLPSDDPCGALIQRLERKAHAFLRQAGRTPDRAQAEQLRSLSVIFGGEAQRLQVAAA
jgi:hypothetical protein